MSELVGSLPVLAFCILIGAMFIGDIISVKTKAFVSSLLVFIIIIIAGVWAHILPANIIEVPGFTGQFASYIILMFLVDMGSSVSIKQLMQQWKTVLIGVGAIVGIAAILLTIGASLFSWELAVAAAPPLSGGLVAAMEMLNAALAAGNEEAAQVASMILLLQSLPGFIIFPIFIKRQAKRLQNAKLSAVSADTLENQPETDKKGFAYLIPNKYKTSAYYLFCVALVAVFAQFTAQLLGGKVSPTVFALAYGIILGSTGVIEQDCIKKSGSNGYLMFASLIAVYTSLLSASPKEIAALAGPVVGLIVLGIIGIGLGSMIIGKFVKVSSDMSFSIGLNCLLGFPMNYMLTNEGIRAVAKDEKEQEALTQSIMPTILIAGFVCVTIGSVVFASIMKNFL